MKRMILFAMILFLLAGASALDQSVCCEKATSGLFCQNVAQSECVLGFKQAPTSCDSTSFCKPGVCYSPTEGTCMDNTPKITCNARNSTWFEGIPAQCDLGCCTLGDQAAFVSLVRCKRLAGSLGIPLNYDKNIKDEVSCVLSVKNQDRGACVYDFEFQKTCKFTTRAECNSGLNGTGQGAFYKDKLCTAEELGTICEKTDKTTCVTGKEEVYFVDTCGNPANVYDSGKKNNLAYWTNVVKPEDSCNPTASNAGNANCGNCNYLLGSICGAQREGSDSKICLNLNCPTTSAGAKKHGESWCVYNDAGKINSAKASVGSRYYKHVCINGKELVEPCADFRQEECIQDSIKTSLGEFSQAACRVNRWQDCIAQGSKENCINTDKRDCLWNDNFGCLPKNPPGLKFWEGDEASSQCAKANANCTVTYEKKGLLGKLECASNCQCLGNAWVDERMQVCNAMGDCGSNINWVNNAGYGKGYNLTYGGMK